MTAVKLGTSNQLNKQKAIIQCPVTYTLTKIGGRWKPIILYCLMGGTKRYSELKRAIPAITEKMLIQHLRELEADDLIKRKVMPVVPPHVEYSLAQAGEELSPVMEAMIGWANKYNKV